jgi:membrane-associated PAP2 superfamily phosphatase
MAETLIGRRALLRLALLLVLFAVVIAFIGTWTNIDLNLANGMYDSAHKDFPWRHTWFAERFSHEIMKNVLTVAAVGAIGVVLFDAWRPFLRWSPLLRMQARVLALAAAAVPLVTSLLKQASVSHCPWDLNQYGGAQPYVRLFEALPQGALAGHCLPAGHASSALWLVALGVFWLPSQPRKALAVSALGLLAGLGLGWVQQMRGAHFLTHTLWSMWIACAVVLTVIALLQHSRRQRARRHASEDGQ